MQWRFILFFLVFVGIIILSNLYVWWRISVFGLGTKWFFFLILISIGLFMMGAADRFFANSLAKWLYILGMTYWGFLFLLFSSLLLTELLRPIAEAKAVTLLAVALALLFTVIALINGQLLVVKEVEIPLSNLKEEIRIVQMSDVHLGSIRGETWLRKAVEKAKATNPDVVVITGDLFDGSRIVTPETLAPFEELDVPIYTSIGNHEIYDGIQKIENVLEKSPVHLLQNEVIDVAGIQLAAINHPAQEMRRDNPEAAHLKIDRKKPAILMYHPPNGAEDAAAAGFDLQLSGHTHNGQIMPFNVLVKIFYPRIRGLYEVDGMKLYTSSGTGTWGPPMRLGSQNEVTLLRLLPKN